MPESTDNLDEAIRDNAAGPKRAQGDAGSVERKRVIRRAPEGLEIAEVGGVGRRRHRGRHAWRDDASLRYRVPLH